MRAVVEPFGKYQLQRRIGSGGMAEVFLARTTVAQGLAKQLVIKKIHPAFARSRQFTSMFVDEAKIALDLNHPNIVQVFDFGQVGESFFLAMEHIEGLDLLRLLEELARRSAPFPHGLAAYVVQQVAKGLDYAHRKTDEFGEPLGIVHRDVSPQNVLISWDGAVKIVDFGIARARHVHEDDGVVKGKFAYMSPEQARGEGVDARSDVYSAGIVLFELTCGRQLFRGKGREVLEAVKAGAIPRPRDINPKVPANLEEAILKALAFYPGDRFESARALQNALGKFQVEEAKRHGELLDSGALAQFVADHVSKDSRPSAAVAAGSPGPGNTPSGPAEGLGAGTGAGGGGAGSEDDRAHDEDDPDAPFARPPTAPNHAAREVRERKYVFVIEGHVCGISALEDRVGPPVARRMVGEFFKVARDIAFKHDAQVHQIENNGFSFLIGLPVATEEDPSRAIRLALALVDALDGIGHDVDPELRLAVGIQRGVAMLHRSPGAKFHYDLGDSTTGIARRLAREAQGAEILVGGAVYRVARHEWTFEELTSIAIPYEETHPGALRTPDDGSGGASQRARVFRLRGPKERAQRLRDPGGDLPELLGRDLELKRLRDAYRDALVGGKKRHILISGDDGVGKRSLVRAFLQDIPETEAVVLHTAARVSTSHTPYAVIADLGRDLLGLAEGAKPRVIRERIEAMAKLFYPDEEQSREVRGLVQISSMLLGGATDGDADIDAEERRERIIQAIRRVEERFDPHRPLVIVGEDVHWADPESMDVFAELLGVPSTRPVLGLVTARPDLRVADMLPSRGAEVIHLDELDPKTRGELIRRRFAPGEDAEELVTQIVARTGGNPFFIREILDALKERGIVVPEPPGSQHEGLLRWVVRDAPIQVPTTVEALLATRIDRLPAAEKGVVLHAAVLGRAFSASAVGALLGRDATAELTRLGERGLLRQNEQSEYAFRNDMAMTVAYRMVPEDDRPEHHRRAAAQIASAPGYRAGQDDAVVARHLELGGDAEAAAGRYLQAAAHAMDVGGNTDALRQLTRALKLLPVSDHERRYTAHHQQQEILARLARRPQQLREIHNLRREAEALGEPSKLSRAHALLAQFYVDVAKFSSAASAVEPALEYAREASDGLAEAEALRLKALVLRAHGQGEEAVTLCDSALALCSEDRPGMLQRSHTLNARGKLVWNLGRLHEAIEAFAESLVICRMLELPRLESQALNNMGVIFSQLGELEEALAHYKSALKIDQDLGNRHTIAMRLGNIGHAYLDLGDLDRAERYLGKAYRLAEQIEDQASICDTSITLGQIYKQRGKHEQAVQITEKGLSLAETRKNRHQQMRALTTLALLTLEAGRSPMRALELAQSATELARDMPMPMAEPYGLSLRARALQALGRSEEAVDLSRRSVAALDAAPHPATGREQILYFRASVCEAAGHTDDARDAAERARAEVKAKASRLKSAELREIYLQSRVPSDIARACERLLAS